MISSTIDILPWFCIFFSLALVYKLISNKTSSKSRPPGPPAWPIIGNILDVGMNPYQNLEKLKTKYGPILWLQLGMSKTLVIQSARAAEECFKKHDLNFADRRVPNSITALDYYKGSLILAPYGEYWRVIRKLCSSELLAHKKISASSQTQQNCIDIMMQWMKEDSDSSCGNGGQGEIQLERYLMLMTFNLLSNFTMSRDIMSSKYEEGNEFYEAMTSFAGWIGTPNLVDSFPFLKWIDPQGIKRNTGKHLKKLLNIVEGFVKVRIEEMETGKGKEKGRNDFLDALLDYGGKEGVDALPIPMKNVTILILEMFMAGTETSSATINWSVAELLRNPESLRKLKDEINMFTVSSGTIKEEDINKLPYLQAVVKETMRLHPAVPLLIPRNSIQETQFMGYFIPKNTMVLINAWAIQRDPETWEDPLLFKPERFIDSNIDSKGQNFELIPFGSGRRSCIGMILGDKVVTLTLAKLVQTFDLKLPSNTSPDTLDMKERSGLSIRKLVPLMVIPTKRNLK